MAGPTLEKAVDKYAQKKLKERAETIARTEIMGSLNGGQVDSWRELQKSGEVGPNAEKEWIVTEDAKTCMICQPLSGVSVPIKEKFSTGGGEVDFPPLHPRCRCAVALTDLLVSYQGALSYGHVTPGSNVRCHF